MKTFLRKAFWYIFAILYFPVYFAAVVLIKVCSILAAIGYALLHEPATARRLLNAATNKRIYGEY